MNLPSGKRTIAVAEQLSTRSKSLRRADDDTAAAAVETAATIASTEPIVAAVEIAAATTTEPVSAAAAAETTAVDPLATSQSPTPTLTLGTCAPNIKKKRNNATHSSVSCFTTNSKLSDIGTATATCAEARAAQSRAGSLSCRYFIGAAPVTLTDRKADCRPRDMVTCVRALATNCAETDEVGQNGSFSFAIGVAHVVFQLA